MSIKTRKTLKRLLYIMRESIGSIFPFIASLISSVETHSTLCD